MMTARVITTPEEADAAWLTEVLHKAGALTAGEVMRVEHGHLAGNWSANAYLALHYSSGARGERPDRLFIKTSHGFGPSEVYYYKRDYVDLDVAPLVRCFDAAYDAAHRRYHLLLQDVSSTHEPVLHRPANRAYAHALANSFAAMHAHWWGASRLSAIGESLPAPRAVLRFVNEARPGIVHLRRHYSGEIGVANLDTIERYLATHPHRLIERLADERGFCLIHGDANPTNILVPYSRYGPPIYLLDRQPFDTSMTVFLGVYDLTHAMVHRWERDNRRQLERPLLRRYHRQLIAHGVEDYRWEQLVADYILCAGMGIYDAVERSSEGPDEAMRWLWQPMIERSLRALADLEGAPGFRV